MLQSETVKKYDTYKDSEIEWIGEIPSDKNLLRNKYFLKYIKGKNPELLNSESKGVPYVGASELDNLTGTAEYENYTEQLELPQCTNSNVLVLWDGARAGLIGKNHCGAISSTIIKLEPNLNKINENYLFYYLKGFEKFLYDRVNGTTIPHMNKDYIEEIRWIDFTIDEQQRIADYLDKKCGEIDRVVETEKAVIEKLKEYKQSIITEAVTKGLDKSAPLKDSGIEWIGRIPEHWEVIKLKKTISLIADIDHYMPDTTDTGYSYLMTGDLKDVASKIDFENCKHISESDYKDLSKKIHPILDDVIFARYATIGTVCYVDIQRDFLVSYSCLTIRPNSEKLFGKFLYYYLNSDTFKIEVSQYINSNTQSNVGLDSLQKVYMVLPNKEEQQQIAEYLDKKCSEIDKAIADKEQVIEKFTEYKKSLIYECVTGKRKVAM